MVFYLKIYSQIKVNLIYLKLSLNQESWKAQLERNTKYEIFMEYHIRTKFTLAIVELMQIFFLDECKSLEYLRFDYLVERNEIEFKYSQLSATLVTDTWECLYSWKIHYISFIFFCMKRVTNVEINKITDVQNQINHSANHCELC